MDFNQTQKDGLLKGIKYFGLVAAILSALGTVFNLFSLIGSVINIFRTLLMGNSEFILRSIVSLVFVLLAIVGSAALAVGFLTTGFQFRKERVTSTFTLIILGVLLSLFSGVLPFIFALVMAVVMFVLLFLAESMPFKDGFNVQAVISDITASVTELLDGMKQKNTASNGSAQTAYTQTASPQSAATPSSSARDIALQTNRSLLMYILLSIITCGIYSWYFIYKMAADVNVACNGDGKKTQGLVVFLLLTLVTCGIYGWFWYYALANRLQENAPRYGLTFSENGTTVLLWMLFGSLLCGIGSFVALHILITNTNAICNAYNRANNL